MIRKVMVRLITAICLFCSLTVSAQEVSALTDDSLLRVAPAIVEPIPPRDTLNLDVEPAPLVDNKSLALPPLTWLGTIAYYPYLGSPLTGFSGWSLHRGLNASLSASAIIGLGSHADSGFSNSLSLMYAGTITPRLSFAVGGYFTFLNYGGSLLRDGGITALLNYRFNEHWEASAFVQKSVMQPTVPPHLYWMSDVGDKIGASLRYHFSPAFSVSLSVWDERRPYGPFPSQVSYFRRR